jgi:aspartokinase/homoserine dehydrogenase 1
MFLSEILKEAIDNGFTEPDPREDLGNDVGRKLILARELICKMNLKKLIQNLTRTFCEGSAADFLTK